MLQSVGFASCSDYSNSLRLQIPELAPWPQRFERFSKLGLVKICLKSQVSPREYVYLIDEPIGTAPTALAALASARMIFGHQRVGAGRRTCHCLLSGQVAKYEVCRLTGIPRSTLTRCCR